MLHPLPLALLLSLLVLPGCCGKRTAVAGTTPTGNAETVVLGPRAVIQSPPTKAGVERRGIVRSAPSFEAAEVTRLTNGTEIAVIQQLPNGWLHVGWPYPSGSSRGYIHQDVVRR